MGAGYLTSGQYSPRAEFLVGGHEGGDRLRLSPCPKFAQNPFLGTPTVSPCKGLLS